LASESKRLPLNRHALRALLRGVRGGLTRRRLRTWAGFTLGFFAFRAIVQAGRRLDGWLYPEAEAQPIQAPVFIFAVARSGTTLLHRLMCFDEERFVPFRLYQSMFSAVCYQRLLRALGRVDGPLLGGRLASLVDRINARFFGGWEGIHELGIDQPEEDETTFVLGLYTPTVTLAFPFLESVFEFDRFDALPAEERERFMDYYEDTLRRHLFASGPERTFLNKNVFFSSRVRSMRERFGDARFIYLVRHPYEAIPSLLDMFHQAWITHSPEIQKDSFEARKLAELACAYYREGLALLEELPPSQLVVLRYEDLVADPKAAVERIYRHLGMEISPAFAARLEAATGEQRRHRSSHHYSLEAFGLSREEVYEALREVFETFGYARD